MTEKNKRKEEAKKNRSIFYQWSLGEQTHQSKKHPTRAKERAEMRKYFR